MAIALGLPPDTPKMEIVSHAAQRIKHAPPIPPKEVATGPVMAERHARQRGRSVQISGAAFAPAATAGAISAPAHCFINRDPETGYVNMGTYRMQVHERNLLGIWQSPGQQGRPIAERYWKQGKACPVVATFGGDPLLFFLSYTKFPFGISELDRAGGMLGHPVEVIKGPLTGLPIPAHAEVVIEGEMPPPDVESRLEGPFGEWPGYYTVGTKGTQDEQPVIRVKAIYYRNDPILLNMAPQWPGAPHHSVRFEGGILWEQLEAAGVPGIVGHLRAQRVLRRGRDQAAYMPATPSRPGMAVLGCAASTARNGRFVVIVDEDIDPSNMKEVIWAMTTRVDPATDIEIVENCWATPFDPRMPPEQTRERAVHQLARDLSTRCGRGPGRTSSRRSTASTRTSARPS